MSERVPCTNCGVTILSETAARTGGLCMPCVKDPDSRRPKTPGSTPPLEDLLANLKSTLTARLLDTARAVVGELNHEGLYGFALYHGQYLYAYATVFTERGLDEVAVRYAAKQSKSTREGLRWSPGDSPHHLYLEDSFRDVEACFEAIGEHYEDEDLAKPIECVFFSCLEALRRSAILPPDLPILLMEGDQGWESRLAYAELFNAPEVVARFRSEIGPINEEHLAHWRRAVPDFRDS